MEIPCQKRIAVVTGANKGIGLEICRQLLERGVTVVLTARDETRGKAAVSKLNNGGPKDIIFHQLDVADPVSIASLKELIQSQFGRLDILEHDLDSILRAMIQHYEKARECIDINYYGTKRMCAAFIPLLQLSKSPKIVNLSSNYGLLRVIASEAIKSELRDADNLTEERLDEIVCTFLNDFKTDNVKGDTWPTDVSAYKVSKVAISAYTRILARKHTDLCINCVHPGYVITDITWNTGQCTVEEGAKGPVMLALLPDGCPSGQFYCQTELSSFE
ncbi:short-chain dehydrogenase/reductase 1-like isoform X2 [Carex rostrata]